MSTACLQRSSDETGRRGHRTSLGYRTSERYGCGTAFNEQTGTGFNDLRYPTDVVLLDKPG